MKVHMKHFQKYAVSKIFNNTHMEICPPENVKFPGIFNFPRALFKMYRSQALDFSGSCRIYHPFIIS